MINIIHRYFTVLNNLYTDPIERYQARLTTMLSALFAVFSFAYTLNALANRGVFDTSPMGLALTVIPIPAALLTFSLVHRRHLRAARFFIFGYFFVFVSAVAVSQNLLRIPAAMLLITPLLGAALFGTNGILTGAGLILATILWGLGGEYLGLLPERAILDRGLLLGALTLMAGSATAGMLLWFTTRASQLSLQTARQEIKRLQISEAINQCAHDGLSNPDLYIDLVNLIKTQLDLYHVQIFLLDPLNQNAVLTASTGDLGTQLMARDHQLPVGSRSVIGRVTDNGQMIYVTDTANSGVHRRNDILTATRAEIAFPLFDGDRIIGALDLQSTQPNAFSAATIELLHAVAGQVAAAITNHRLLENTRHEVADIQRKHEETRQTLIQTERINRQLTSRAWEDYLSRGQDQLGIHLVGNESTAETTWTAPQREAVTKKRPVYQTDEEHGMVTLAVPLEVRGLALGALEVTIPESGPGEDALEFVEAISNRLALALDNNRLFEEASTRAEQERKIGEIASHLQGTVQVEEMLKIAVQELQSAIGASRGSIRLRSTLAANPAEATEQ